jgi:hypothetical protein
MEDNACWLALLGMLPSSFKPFAPEGNSSQSFVYFSAT